MLFSLRTALVLSVLFLPAVVASASDGLVVSFNPPREVARLRCTAQVQNGVVTCVRSAADALSDVPVVNLAGAQGRYLGEARVWAADVVLHNPTELVFGAAEGSAADAAGIQVRVLGAPRTSAGAGTVAVLNANRSVFQYEGALLPGETSGARTWQFDVPQSVAAFTFDVSVVASATFPRPWANLSAPSPTGFSGTTQALTGATRTRNGAVVPGALRTWTSSDVAVATVDATGSVTSVAPGTATITASVNGLSAGTSSISVCPGLDVGQVYHFSTGTGASFCLGGGAATAEYTVIPTNESTTSSIPLTFVANGIVGGTNPVPTSAFAEPQPAPAMDASALVLPGKEADVREADAAHLEARARDREEVASVFATQGVRLQAQAATASAVPSVGDVLSFNVAQGCTGTRDVRTGQVRAITDHIIAVHDTANPFGENFTVGNNSYYRLDSLAARVERIAWPSITSAFGTPTDVDGNGRVILFFTRAVNELSPAASGVTNAGFFASRDVLSSATCNLSNEGEILYMLVPDPTGAVNSNVRTESSVVGQTTRIAGHELQHLINASRRLYVTGAPTLEESWLDEGLSFVAEELMFYRESAGLAPRGNINLSSLTTGPFASRRVAAFNTYQNQNFGRLRGFLQRPDTTGAYKSAAFSNTTVMTMGRGGATWSFLRYAADRRNGDDNAFWTAISGNATLAGQANLQTALGLTADELKTWYRDWMVALYTDDTVVANVSAIHQTTSWNLRSVFGGLGGFPMRINPLANGTPLVFTFSPGGSTSFLRVGVAAGTFATLSTTTGGLPPGSDVGLTLVRTK